MNFYVIAASVLMVFELVVPRAKIVAPQHVLSVALTTTPEGEEQREVRRRPVVIEPLAPTRIEWDSLGVAMTARTALVKDMHSKAVLWEQNPHEVRPIASITKLVTALVALSLLSDFDAEVAILPEDYINEGFNSIPVGGQFTARDILAAVLIESNNTATHALVRATGKSREEFVVLMNDYVKTMGLTRTLFIDPTGLSAGNVSTAAEVVAFAERAFADDVIASLTGSRSATFASFTGTSYTVRSTNQLLGSMISIRCGKTGFVNESGYNLVAEASRDGHSIIAVVLGSSTNEDRFQDYKMLAHWTWEHFVWPEGNFKT